MVQSSIEELKRAFPMPNLLGKLGYADRAKKSARCMLHEDKRNSFSVFQGGDGSWRAKCHAGCFSGDELDFIQAFFDLPDTKRAIAKYAELAGMGSAAALEAIRLFQGKARPAKVVQEPKPLGPPAKLQKLTLSAADTIGAWRGLRPKFLMDMTELGIFGLWDNKPAFVAEGGVQFRVPNDGWRYSPGAKTDLLILGEPDSNKEVFVVESNWDALAAYTSSFAQVICTRGAANARLAIDYINELSKGESMSVVVIPHNDKPGEDWANDLKAGLMLHEVKVRRVPAPYKDFAELHAAKKAKP